MNRTIRAGLVAAVVAGAVFAISYDPVDEPVIPRPPGQMTFESSWSREWDSLPWVGHSWFAPWTIYQSDPPTTYNTPAAPVYTEPVPWVPPSIVITPRSPDILWVPSAPVDRRPELAPPQPPDPPPLAPFVPLAPRPSFTPTPRSPPVNTPAPVYEHALPGAEG